MNRNLQRAIMPLLFLGASSIFSFYRGNLVEIASTVQFDAYLEGGPPPATRRKYFWEKRQETACFNLDNICHGNDRWFYIQGDTTSYQPTITYVQDNVTNSHGYIPVEPRVYFNISASSVEDFHDGSCPMHPTPFHMVTQSAYNDMMGEFYSRSLVALNQLLRDNPIPGSYYSDLQMYLHVVQRKKHKLLEGHRLFLEGLPNNNKFDSFLSLIEDEGCQCFQKLIFCGYDVELASEYVPVNKSSSIPYLQLPPEYKSREAKVFKPVGYIKSRKTTCTRKTAGKFDLRSSPCLSYKKLRRDIYKTYAEKDALLSQKIIEYRKQILLLKGAVDGNVTSNEVNEWTYVGLAKRKKRRAWLNIDDSITTCDEKFMRYKVVCLAVDVEDADSPEQQLLMHRSLHALVGVHGAQLTQGILLPPHGKILELLPWIPTYLIGNWVQWTNRPTPLGIIYHKTDLNHLGYKLDRDSVPLCFNVSSDDAEGLRECFMSEGHLKKFQWATRSFTVEPDVVHNFITQFVLNTEYVCDKMQARAKENGFVLYNAYCKSDEVNTRFQTEHYFVNNTQDGV